MAIGTTVRIGFRNLGRNRKRTLLALLAIGLAQAVLILFQGAVLGYRDWILATVTGPMVGHVQLHAPKWRDERALDLSLAIGPATLTTIQATPGVRAVYQRIYVPVLAAAEEDGRIAVVTGIDFAQEVGEGRLLAAGTVAPARGSALIGKTLAASAGVKVGDTLAVMGQATDGSIAAELYRVAGIARTQVDLINEVGIVVSLEDARALAVMPEAVHELVVVGDDAAQAPALAQRLKAVPELSAAEVLPWLELIPEMRLILAVMDAYQWVIAAILFIAAGASVANTLAMSTFERTRELGVLLALGLPPARLIGIVFVEGVTLGLAALGAGSVLGVALVAAGGRTGWDLTRLVGGAEQLSFAGLEWSMRVFPRIAPANLVVGAVAVAVTTLLASLWPAAHAARLQPVEAMRA